MRLPRRASRPGSGKPPYGTSSHSSTDFTTSCRAGNYHPYQLPLSLVSLANNYQTAASTIASTTATASASASATPSQIACPKKQSGVPIAAFEAIVGILFAAIAAVWLMGLYYYLKARPKKQPSLAAGPPPLPPSDSAATPLMAEAVEESTSTHEAEKDPSFTTTTAPWRRSEIYPTTGR